MYKMSCLTNASFWPLNAKNILLRIFCVSDSASCFSCAYSLTIKTSTKLEILLISEKTEAHWITHVDMEFSRRSLCVQLMLFFTLHLQSKAIYHVSVGVMCRVHKTLDRGEIGHYPFRPYFRKYRLKIGFLMLRSVSHMLTLSY